MTIMTSTLTSTLTSLRPLPCSLLAVLLLLGPGCAGVRSAPEGAGEAGEDDEKAEEEQGLARKLEVAKLELDLAKLDAEQDLADAEQDMAAAKVGAEKARLERQAFAELGRTRELDEAKLSLDQSRGRAEDAAAELAELEAMYAEEEFATKTKELVITRSRRDLEHAQRSLDLAGRKLKETEGFELPGKEQELEKDRLAAEKAVLEAQQGLDKVRLEKKIAIAKAEQELEELSRKAEKAKAKKAKKAEAAEGKEKP